MNGIKNDGSYDNFKLECLNVFKSYDIENELSKSNSIIKVSPDKFLYKNSQNRNYNEIIDNLNKMNSKSELNMRNDADSCKKITDKEIITSNVKIGFNELIFFTQNNFEYDICDLFEFISILGEGSFGVVVKVSLKESYFKYNYLCSFKVGDLIALKIITINNSKNIDTYKKEASILKGLKSEYIIKIFNIHENTKFLILEMELMEGGTLKFDIIDNYYNKNKFLYSEEECSNILKCILEGISYLHHNNIIHRDIKPDNLMLFSHKSYNKIKIIDLGLSCKFETKMDQFYEVLGTSNYMAPEFFSDNPLYNYLVDIWAAGIVLYILLSGGSHPVSILTKDNSEKEYSKIILNRKYWYFNKEFSP